MVCNAKVIDMAESKGALIAKSVQKHAGRAKEKLLQNLGKVDRTLDDIFEEHLQNFNRQHQQATRLQKEFNNYIRCIRAVQTASKTLMEAISDAYESGWSGHDLMYIQAQNMEMLWQDFSHKLGDQVLIPLNTYTNQFPEVRKKIEKRGRKLVDYDSQRHSFQNLQSNAAKRRDDVKITKGREQLEEAKRTYEVLNSELHDELPALYDSRVLFYVNNLQTLFASEQLFHSESAKVFSELEAITDKLATDCQRGSYTKKAISNNISPITSPKTNTLNSHNGNAASPTNTIQTSPNHSPVNGSAPALNNSSDNDSFGEETPEKKQEYNNMAAENKMAEETKEDEPKVEKTNGHDKIPDDKDDFEIPNGPPPVAPEKSSNNGEPREKKENADKNDSKGDDVYDIPVGATLSGLPPGVLYRVRATYRYTREDSDELSFEVGDVIRVVEYDDPEEQEEGWLMGIKEGTNEKGMFPANFTRPI